MILSFKKQSQMIAAFGSSYRVPAYFTAAAREGTFSVRNKEDT
ncbi:hypothetical protein EMIT0232MI5_20106 [Pseudomonas sp. IT-232MI5]